MAATHVWPRCTETRESDGAEDLQKLLQNLEFENKQQLILIDKENQQIEAIEKDLKSKQEEIKSLQESTGQLDEQTKRVHGQFKQNRENLGSLKKTYDVLVDHEKALAKKFERLKVAWETDKAEQERAILQYESTWESYKNKYESNSLAKELAKQLTVLQDVQQHAEVKRQAVEDLRSAVDIMKGKQEKPFENQTKWAVSLAEVGKELDQTESEIGSRQHKISELQQKYEELKLEKQKAIEPSNKEVEGSKELEQENMETREGQALEVESEILEQASENTEQNQHSADDNFGSRSCQETAGNTQQRHEFHIEIPSVPQLPSYRNHVSREMPQINIPQRQLSPQVHREIRIPQLQTMIEKPPCPTRPPKQLSTPERPSVHVPQLHLPAMTLGSPQQTMHQKPHQQSPNLLCQLQKQQLQRKLENLLPSVPPIQVQTPPSEKQVTSQPTESRQPQPCHFNQVPHHRGREVGDNRVPSLLPNNTVDNSDAASPPQSQMEDDSMDQPQDISHCTTPVNAQICDNETSAETPQLTSPPSQNISPFDEARHAEYLESLRKSPGFSYASRAMYGAGQANSTNQQDTDKSQQPQQKESGAFFGTQFLQSAFEEPFSRTQFGASTQGDNNTGNSGTNPENSGCTSIFGPASSPFTLSSGNNQGGSLFGQNESSSSTSDNINGFAMFGFSSSADNSSSPERSGFSFNFGGGSNGGNSPKNSSGAFSLF